MPTKAQANTAIDNAATAVKNNINTFLPTNVNITNGQISFNPLTWSVSMDAGGSAATSSSWVATITTNLTNAAIPFIVRQSGRRDLDTVKNYTIVTAQFTYFINNAG